MTEIEIRKKLEAIVSRKSQLTWELQVEHIEKIIGKKALSSSLVWEEDDEEFVKEVLQDLINCHAYALGLWKLNEFIEKASDYRTKTKYHLINSSVMDELIKAKLITPVDPVENCLVLYLTDQGKIEHSGLLRKNNCVESKWGILPVFEHGIWHVPESYGERNVCYTYQEPEEILEYLKLKSPR